MEVIRNRSFDFIAGDILSLKLIFFNEGDEVEIPYYWYEIFLNSTGNPIGKISIRIGHNYHSYFNGNIGYEIDEEYRGHNYSLIASKMVLEIAKYYNMSDLVLTCDEDNVASYKTIEKLGAKLIEIIYKLSV